MQQQQEGRAALEYEIHSLVGETFQQMNGCKFMNCPNAPLSVTVTSKYLKLSPSKEHAFFAASLITG
ncbi:MAG: hypothetical protein LBT26_06680 [Clostridiales Family XIII bacterium]|nr:hypothetical protein [Clostridiales Family XIII bacterium]